MSDRFGKNYFNSLKYMNYRYLLIAVTAILSLPFLNGCNRVNDVPGWNFEDESLEGWSLEGDAFDLSRDVRFADYRYYLQEGSWHVLGNRESTGTLRSPNFYLKGTGHISFLLGGNPDAEGAYLTINRSKDNHEIGRFYNDEYQDFNLGDTYVREIVDLSQHLNQELYIELVDTSSILSINIDDVLIDIDNSLLEDLETDKYVRLGITVHPDMREAADFYIRLNAHRIRDDRRFSFHLSGETGWINDPNGFSFMNNKINLFYQHNPYSTNWGPMHWGHATSDDFVKWEYQDVALAPDQDYDAVGAFSGSAIAWNGKYYLLYTGASIAGQVQCLAVSDDGITFKKYEGNPVIAEDDLPADTTIRDFRDPKLFVRGDWVYSIISARNASNDFSKLLLYRTQDMFNWHYAGKVLSNSSSMADVLGVMLECPDIVSFDNKDVVIVSPQTVTNHRNNDGNVYIPGTMDWTRGVLNDFDISKVVEIDNGFDFYAPQTMMMPDGRVIMVAWMAGWSRRPITTEFGFAGAMTFPREIIYVDDHLVQYPVTELLAYREDELNLNLSNISNIYYDDSLFGNVKDIEVSFTPTSQKSGITVFDDKNGNSAKIYYDNGNLCLERFGITNGYYPQDDINNKTCTALPLVDGKVVLRVLLDKYSIEVFGANGLRTITATGMPSDDQIHIGFYSDIATSFEISAYNLDL